MDHMMCKVVIILLTQKKTQVIRQSLEGFWAQDAFDGVKVFSEAAGLPEIASQLSEKISVYLHIKESVDDDGRWYLLLRTCAEYQGQSDIEELPVYLGQKWRSSALDLTCWVDDDSVNIEINGSSIGSVRRKYQVSVDGQQLLLTTTLVKTTVEEEHEFSSNNIDNEISCQRYFNRQMPMF